MAMLIHWKLLAIVASQFLTVKRVASYNYNAELAG